MRKLKGVSIAQYAIIIVLIALALVPVFYVVGQNLFSNFKGFNDILAEESNEQNQTTTNSLPSDTTSPDQSSTNGIASPESPIRECSGGFCTIDFGEIVLKGLPDNFPEIVETTGSSSGTEILAGLLEQINDQLEDTIPEESRQNFEDLANLGHILADFQKHIEDKAKECSTTNYANACFHNFICSESTFTPDDPALLNNFPSLNLSGTVGNLSVYNDRIGGAMHDYLEEPDIFNASNNVELAFTIVDRYNKVQNDPNFSETQKAIVKEMYWQIAIMAEEIDAKVWGVSGINEQVLINDPITGVGEFLNVTNFTNEDIFTPQSSNVTDIDSAVICATGQQADTGKVCH